MEAVLYTHQLEPITVVDIPPFLWDMLARGQSIRLPVWESVWREISPSDPIDKAVLRTVTIWGERLCRNEYETLMLFTEDEEDALQLRAAFLPGQHGSVHNRKNQAFKEGFLLALRLAGGE